MITMIHTMNIEVQFEFNDEELSAVDATDLIDYFGKAKVEVDDERINILGAYLISK
jgi:hypothetical protein